MIQKLLAIFFTSALLTAFPQSPTASIIVPSNTICTNRTIIFNSISTNTPTSFNWLVTPSTGVTYLGSINESTTGVGFTYQGNYLVSLTVANISGTFTATQTVTVSLNPRANFSASLTTTGFPNQIVLTNFSSFATNYTWMYSDTPLTDNTTDANHSYNASGAFTVSLVAANTSGCTDTSRYSFYISDSSGVTLPNVFTPNGDGVNDVFKPIARGVKSMKVRIYNRYGILVSTWDTVSGHWDGYTTSGILCESGTYFCVLEAIGFDGVNYKKNGYISLFRN